MIGTTIVYTTDTKSLKKSSLESIFKSKLIKRVELDSLDTLDFSIFLTNTGLKWNDGNPLLMSMIKGLVIFKVNPLALEYVVKHDFELDDVKKSDKEKLKAFVEENGMENIYEIAIF